MSKADMWDTPNKEPTETKAKVGDTPTIIPPQANTLDEIDNKMFNLNGLAHIVTRDKIAIQALITEARIDELNRTHDGIADDEDGTYYDERKELLKEKL